MLSVWSSPQVRSVRQRVPHGAVVAAVLMLLLVLCISNSTVSAGGVPHSEGLTGLAPIAAVVMAFLALPPVPWRLALGLGLAAAPFAGYLASYSTVYAAHPQDPTDPL